MRRSGNKTFFKGKVGADAKAQDTKTLAMLLREYDSSGAIPFHMPGHKRNKKLEYLNGAQTIDVTEIEGFDNLHNSKDMLKYAQQRTADFFCVKESRYLVGGSTSGILAAIRATTHAGDGVLIARNCHKSVYNAVELCALRPYYVMPAYFEEYGFYGSVMPEDVQRELLIHRDIKLVVITSPTYECVHYLTHEGAGALEAWSDMVDKFRRSFARSKKFKIFNGAREGRVFAYDKTKLVFLTVESSMSGIDFMRTLRSKYKIELEMASSNYALAMTGAGDGLSTYLALSEAVFELENEAGQRRGLVNINGVKLPKKAFEPYEIDTLDLDFVDFENSVGHVAAENIWAYPPGAPIICKGEIIAQDVLRHALFLYECGVNVESERRAFPDNIFTVAQPSIYDVN